MEQNALTDCQDYCLQESMQHAACSNSRVRLQAVGQENCWTRLLLPNIKWQMLLFGGFNKPISHHHYSMAISQPPVKFMFVHLSIWSMQHAAGNMQQAEETSFSPYKTRRCGSSCFPTTLKLFCKNLGQASIIGQMSITESILFYYFCSFVSE